MIRSGDPAPAKTTGKRCRDARKSGGLRRSSASLSLSACEPPAGRSPFLQPACDDDAAMGGQCRVAGQDVRAALAVTEHLAWQAEGAQAAGNSARRVPVAVHLVGWEAAAVCLGQFGIDRRPLRLQRGPEHRMSVVASSVSSAVCGAWIPFSRFRNVKNFRRAARRASRSMVSRTLRPYQRRKWLL